MAISTAALALVLRSAEPWMICRMALSSATSMPTRRGAISLLITSMIEPCVSPVITAVAAASP